MRSQILAITIFFAFLATGCVFDKGELGSARNPVKLYFVPSIDAKIIEHNSKIFKDWLEKKTPYKFEVGSPSSFIAVVEAFGSKRADVASMNTFGYILANEKYGAEARLLVVRYGLTTYQGQFLARAGGPIKKLSDFNGRKIAFVDPASTSGYLLPKKILNDRHIKPAQEVFAMRHDAVVSMIYQGQVDGGATFYAPPENGKIQDARHLVLTPYPDVEKKVKIVELTEAVPNDPIVFRKDLPEDMKKTIADAFVQFVHTPEGVDTFYKTYGVTDLRPTTDRDYDNVRAMLKSLGKTADELIKQ